MSEHHVTHGDCAEHPDRACFVIEAELGTGPLRAHLEYVVVDCDEHDNCTAIVMTQTGVLMDLDHDGQVDFAADLEAQAVSHAPAALHAEHRLNLTYPEATDLRGEHAARIKLTPPCAACLAHPDSLWRMR